MGGLRIGLQQTVDGSKQACVADTGHAYQQADPAQSTGALLFTSPGANQRSLTSADVALAINPAPGELVVNIGDMLQRLTNDVLPSTTHRVINPPGRKAAQARYSLPFFLHFRPDYLIRSLPQCVSQTRPDRYPEPITADAYLHQRLREIRLA